jgi:hypothetical protein
MGGSISKQLSKEAKSALASAAAAAAMDAARAAIKALPLGEQIMQLADQAYHHTVYFRENNELAVKLGRRCHGLSETVKLAGEYIQENEEMLALKEVLLEANGLLSALKEKHAVTKFVKASTYRTEFDSIDKLLRERIGDMNLMISAKNVKATTDYSEEILEALKSEKRDIESIIEAQNRQEGAFEELYGHLQKLQGAPVAEAEEVVSRLASVLECKTTEVKDAVGAVVEGLDGKFDSVFDSLTGLHDKMDGHARDLKDVKDHLGELRKEKEKEDQKTSNRAGSNVNFKQLSLDPSEFELDPGTILGAGGSAKVYGGTYQVRTGSLLEALLAQHGNNH